MTSPNHTTWPHAGLEALAQQGAELKLAQPPLPADSRTEILASLVPTLIGPNALLAHLGTDEVHYTITVNGGKDRFLIDPHAPSGIRELNESTILLAGLYASAHPKAHSA